jgi:acetyl-CoA C-acetyltransferase
MPKVAVVGVGNSRFGRRDDALLQEIAFEAVREALQDADLSQKEIDLSVVGTVGSRSYEALPAGPINDYCGFSDKGPIRVEAACATGSAALFTAHNSIASGAADTAIVIGAEKMTEVDIPTTTAVGGRGGSYLWEFHMLGTSFAAYYALYATKHMSKFGTTPEDLARVSVKGHKYAAMNPKACFQKEIKMEDALNSKVIASPLKLYDCCPVSDGAAAVVLASEDKVRKAGLKNPVWIDAIGYGADTSNLTRRSDYVGLNASVNAAKMAYNSAKVGPEKVDVATVHDCFTIAEIMAYEDLGFCPKGKGKDLLRDGETEIGGRIPVNLDGGLKAKGHPLGATGVSMVYELTKQLRGESGKRQARLRNNIALAHNVGGHGFSAYVTILRGP